MNNNQSKTTTPIQDLPLQLIRYGAPGTGKSHGVKEITELYKERTVRTTFHPDSDYSTFVGSYKPVMSSPERIYSVPELISLLKDMKDSSSYPCQKFGAKYWRSLQPLPSNVISTIVNQAGFTESFFREIQKGIAVGVALLNNNSSDSKIIYTYVPQAFLKAYVDAWKDKEKPEFLIIEEINRGNCAQIFGDLFQLLDRNDDGVSDYPINPDKDIQQYLAGAFAECDGIPEKIKSGEQMLLPNNLYIWATMNTSDQSLFPIDSAFKRRWDWEYVPITEGTDENGATLNWRIEFSNQTIQLENGTEKPFTQDWWEFLKKINAIISGITDSADKQLGYFFCKAKDGIINAKTFVNKVVFYLWNDVFKDYGFDDANLFGNGKDDSGNTKLMTFSDFYKETGEINEQIATIFVKNVINWVSSKSGN
ncbi:MAG: hypothetical protein MJZ66_04060 [Bacteroidales bacterium]|nr:hypothetical protein [Bacteroidales bacterium]